MLHGLETKKLNEKMENSAVNTLYQFGWRHDRILDGAVGQRKMLLCYFNQYVFLKLEQYHS